jgi:hypothetical protein
MRKLTLTATATTVAAVLGALTPLPAAAWGGPGLQRADLNRDGVIDRTEVEQLRAERFARLDANGDGFVDPSERVRPRQRGPQSAGPQAPWAGPQAPWAGPQAPWAGPQAPGAGPQAMPYPQGAWGGRHKGPGGHGNFFSRMDRDGDGRVSREEFMGRPHRMFERVDVNRDGRITGEELAAKRHPPCFVR